MAFDKNSIPTGYLREVLELHRQDLEGFVARRVLATPSSPILEDSGVIRVWDQRNEYGQDRRSSKVSDGASTPERSSRLKQIAYDCQEYRIKDSITRLARMELDEGLDAAGRMTFGCAQDVLHDLDTDLATILKAGGAAADNDLITANSLSAGEEFDNYDSSTHNPFDVIEGMKRRTRGDMLIIGENILQALQQSPDYTTPENPNRGPGELVNMLQVKHGFREVVVADYFYQSGSTQFDLNRTGIFDDVCAVGRSDSLYLVLFEDLYTDMWEDKDTRKDYVRSGLTADIVVAEKANWEGIDANILE
jgi:hypothetical protein